MTPASLSGASDRLLVAILGALVLHVAVILGIRFKLPEVPRVVHTLDVELVWKPDGKRPDHADYQAQANSEGGGAERRKRKVPPPAVSARPSWHDGQPKRARRLHKPPLLRSSSRRSVPVEDSPPVQEPRLDRRLLARQIAELGVVPDRRIAFHQDRVLPLHRIRAYKHIAAAYERAWQEKVERIGNLNYPDEARRKDLSGRLLISVWVARDGAVRKVKIHRSSGSRVLDDAALRIIRLAAPFAPFPKELTAQVDVLVITRTWKFHNDAVLAMDR